MTATEKQISGKAREIKKPSPWWMDIIKQTARKYNSVASMPSTILGKPIINTIPFS